jgi:hypothetical protein
VSHMKDIPWGHETRVVEEEKVEKEVAHIPPGEGTRSLWLFGELLTCKVPSRQTGGAYTLLRSPRSPRQNRRCISITARMRPSMCS